MSSYNLADLFELVCDSAPADREALVIDRHRLTYRELEARANRLAHYFSSRGLGAGDHIGLHLYNCREYIEGMLACFKIRAVPINVNFRFVEEELHYMYDNADLKASIFGREFMPALNALKPTLPLLDTLLVVDDGSEEALSSGAVAYEEALATGSAERDFAPRSEDDLFILYTGGTTGQPKGVMWPHLDLFLGCFKGLGLYPGSESVQSPQEVGQRVREGGFYMRSMPLAPLMHGACWWYSCLCLLQGHTLVLYSGRSLKGDEVFDIVEREKVNGISFVGDAMALPLLQALEQNPKRWELSQVFSIGSGGAVFSQSVQQRLNDFMPNAILSNSFGSSETGNQGQDDGSERDEGLGRISRNETADVITEDGRQVEAGSGEMGYLARSGYLALGYYKDAEKTAKSFRTINGKRWVLTGDLATVDAEGGIIVYGRGSNCINSGGEKIFPEEVEEALKSHPAVYDALVVGVPDQRFSERVTAVVQFNSNQQASLVSLQDECRKHIAGYKVPRELHGVEKVSRSPSGKPDYKWAKIITDQKQHLLESLPLE